MQIKFSPVLSSQTLITSATTTALNVSVYDFSSARMNGTASVQASGRWY